MSVYAAYTGSQIKKYRKLRKLSLQQLAEKIGKSQPTLSKYENGSIVVDIETLYDIANALQISITHLLKVEHVPTISDQADAVKPASYYLYFFDEYARKVVTSIFETFPQDQENRAVMYYDIADGSKDTCKIIWTGLLYDDGASLSASLWDSIYQTDKLYLCFANSVALVTYRLGLVLTFSACSRNPLCLKALLSKFPVKDLQMAADLLSFGKEDLLAIRRKNRLEMVPVPSAYF